MKECAETKETTKEQSQRIEAMLETMVFEAKLKAMKEDEPIKRFSTQEIADFCGCSRNTIQRIEKSALNKIKSVLRQ